MLYHILFIIYTSHTSGTRISPQWRAPSTPPAAASAGVGREGRHCAAPRAHPLEGYPAVGLGAARPGFTRTWAPGVPSHTEAGYPALGLGTWGPRPCARPPAVTGAGDPAVGLG